MMTRSDKDRFDEKWEVGEEGCWIWTGATKGWGYGNFRYKGKARGAHRVSYRLHVGEIPDGKMVLHTCDVRACVNPDHLYVGDDSDNRQDMWDRDRRNADGEHNPSAKLTEREVEEIRQKYHSEGRLQQSLADEYGVDQSNISLIVNRESWIAGS